MHCSAMYILIILTKETNILDDTLLITMNTDLVIDNDWVAIREFPVISGSSDPNESELKDDIQNFQVIWDDDRHLLSIFYQKCKGNYVSNNMQWKYNVSFGIDALIALHERLKELIPELYVDLPTMPTEPKG